MSGLLPQLTHSADQVPVWTQNRVACTRTCFREKGFLIIYQGRPRTPRQGRTQGTCSRCFVHLMSASWFGPVASRRKRATAKNNATPARRAVNDRAAPFGVRWPDSAFGQAGIFQKGVTGSARNGIWLPLRTCPVAISGAGDSASSIPVASYTQRDYPTAAIQQQYILP